MSPPFIKRVLTDLARTARPEYRGGQGLRARAAAERESSANRRMKILCILITQASQTTEQPNSRRQGAKAGKSLWQGMGVSVRKKSRQVIFVIQRVDCAEDGFLLGEKKDETTRFPDETAYKSHQNEVCKGWHEILPIRA
ncbi:hypothetical protein CEXT_134631 [Caerostris extrusa]|uniref:Uncharacterized protein n=1 Tax=Caerostris extrusa TaxID=172846 RepID=A0AAV4ST63_CAEEX|nr:hypothetical protein CEXT_134631 [Caerostris extrusa]